MKGVGAVVAAGIGQDANVGSETKLRGSVKVQPMKQSVVAHCRVVVVYPDGNGQIGTVVEPYLPSHLASS